jgi:hypothetical protein
MRTSELRGWLEELEESRAPEPSPGFVAKLEADLLAMDQSSEADTRQARPASRTRRVRLLVAAGPVAALTAAAAAAAVTLLPGDPHPRRVTTADPGITAPAHPADELAQPAPTTTPTTSTAPPWLPPQAAPPATTPTTAVRKTTPKAPAPDPGDHTATTIARPAGDPVSTTVPRATTTTAPAPETLSLQCTAGVSGGNPTVFCGWSQSTSSAFKWYRLWRESAGSPPAIVFQSDNRSTTGYYDHTVQAGTNYYYKVDITDAAGNVIGHSDIATAACC